MIIVENLTIKGKNFVRHYSDKIKKLVRNDGAVFYEAVDVEGIGYTYTESDEDIEVIETEDIEQVD